ncbi:DUF192 domain-containing protein [Azoarcus communis]|uniref:DUF192 domain-containing protein n=1 Tax=Parazoarcus communis SWub3 = DSM 12120 TaxID=1121029 RepID=A0A323UVX0_9RHOO|nr:DUF192 domain-containing protein [Parazoarcus communis]NMG70424.1 DUF192 domain-containing protein [Parazoarcus communis SWub3 = DSM 12120]PZA17152.1 DUF192 domain-containing protein [Azoarcus communis] [Parazoarcus communis SWub3 = DSM 12120]
MQAANWGVGVARAWAVLLMALPAMAAAAMPVVELGAGMFRIQVEVAHTDANRQLGLMNRREMPAHNGMVFVFPQDARHCMWMRNTFIPLSVAFLDEQGRILNIADMQPQTEDSHCAAAPARFALEMNQGWFRERGLKPGDAIRGVDRLPAPR